MQQNIKIMENPICRSLIFIFCFFGFITYVVAFTTKCDGSRPCEAALSSANEQFKKCCDIKNLGACTRYCRYNVTISELKLALLKTSECKVTDVQDFLECAANDENNNPCCEKSGVLDGPRKVCTAFCNPKGGDWLKSQGGAAKYFKCLSQFDRIVQCHYASRISTS